MLVNNLLVQLRLNITYSKKNLVNYSAIKYIYIWLTISNSFFGNTDILHGFLL